MFNFLKIDLGGINLFDIKAVFRRKKLNKTTANILFVDDEKFPVVDNLRQAGWSVDRIRDVTNINGPEVSRADVVFVDYKGVGRSLSETEEGIGVIREIKRVFKDKKRVILYSGYGRFKLGEHLSVADNQLPKDSNTSEFISMIESELRKIR